MNNTDFIESSILRAILEAIEEEAKVCVSYIETEYSILSHTLGNAEARYEVYSTFKNTIVMSLFGKGQKALIGEFGSGSLMDRTNPALKEYMDGDIFNKERLKYNMAIITRINDTHYWDLDGRVIIRPKPKNEVNLEKKNPKRYAPVKPRHIILSTLHQRMYSILESVALAVAKQVAFKKLFDGRKLKVTL